MVGKHQGQISERWILRKKEGAWLHGLCNCSTAVLRLGECQWTDLGHALLPYTMGRGTDESAMTQRHKSVELNGRMPIGRIRSKTDYYYLYIMEGAM